MCCSTPTRCSVVTWTGCGLAEESRLAQAAGWSVHEAESTGTPEFARRRRRPDSPGAATAGRQLGLPQPCRGCRAYGLRGHRAGHDADIARRLAAEREHLGRREVSAVSGAQLVLRCGRSRLARPEEEAKPWGVSPGLEQLGTKGEQIARFPHPKNLSEFWHGYPVSALDDKARVGAPVRWPPDRRLAHGGTYHS